MRGWLYHTLVNSPDLQGTLTGVSPSDISERIIPRRSQQTIPQFHPFIIFGLGNATDEGLNDQTAVNTDVNEKGAQRQFFEVWVHDRGGSYDEIDFIVGQIIRLLSGASDLDSRIITVLYLETSQEFANETYNTLFRYIRFQAVLATG